MLEETMKDEGDEWESEEKDGDGEGVRVETRVRCKRVGRRRNKERDG